MAAEALYVEATGEGPPVVLAHGFAGSARNWRPQVRALRGRYRVVTYDARGHARSPAPDDPSAYTREALVGDLAAVVAAAGAPAVVGGLSMGAAVALALALQQPAGVRALVLASVPPGAASGRGIAGQAVRFAEALEREGVEAAGARFAWGPDTRLDAAGAARVRQGFLEHPAHGLSHTLRGVLASWPTPEELAPALGRLQLPALVLAGGEDAGRDVSRAVARALPRAVWREIPGAGHVVNLAAPEAFNEALLEFLERFDERS